jgi:hypothetical protein
MPVFSIMELLVVLLYLGHFSGCFFYLLSTPPYQTPGVNGLSRLQPLLTKVQRCMAIHPRRVGFQTTHSPTTIPQPLPLSLHALARVVERRLIEEGEMETWIMTSFGGDRIVVVPTLYHGNTSFGAALSHIGQDPGSKQ